MVFFFKIILKTLWKLKSIIIPRYSDVTDNFNLQYYAFGEAREIDLLIVKLSTLLTEHFKLLK